MPGGVSGGAVITGVAVAVGAGGGGGGGSSVGTGVGLGGAGEGVGVGSTGFSSGVNMFASRVACRAGISVLVSRAISVIISGRKAGMRKV